MHFDLKNRVALVTGASSGLGRHFAKVLSAAGCTVGIAARRLGRLEELDTQIKQAGGKAVVLEMDVTDRLSIERGVSALNNAAGPVTILVNNAGMAVAANFIEAEEQDTKNVFALNQLAVWQVAQVICRQLIKHRQGGSVINVSSIAGLGTVSGIASYAVSKAAVVQMTKVMALELARYGIRVNSIAPGYCDTELNHDFLHSKSGLELVQRVPMRRFGKLEDLDGVLLLLASDSSAYMTGTVIPVDGGHLLSHL